MRDLLKDAEKFKNPEYDRQDLIKLFQDSHKKADTDAERSSLHHTLGKGPTQAASGDHSHDGPPSIRLAKTIADQSWAPGQQTSAYWNTCANRRNSGNDIDNGNGVNDDYWLWTHPAGAHSLTLKQAGVYFLLFHFNFENSGSFDQFACFKINGSEYQSTRDRKNNPYANMTSTLIDYMGAGTTVEGFVYSGGAGVAPLNNPSHIVLEVVRIGP